MADRTVLVHLGAENASFIRAFREATMASEALLKSTQALNKELLLTKDLSAVSTLNRRGKAAGAAALATDKLAASTAVLNRELAATGAAGAKSSAALGGAAAAAKGAARETEAAGSRLEKTLKTLGTMGGLAFIVAAGASVKMAGDFQQKTSVLVTAAGESIDKLGQVRKGIQDIAMSTGTNWHEVVDGMYQIEKAGYRGAEGLKILKAAAQAAKEEGASLATVTAATTSVMQSYLDTYKGPNGAVQATNQIKTAAGEAKTTMELFAASLSTVLPIASANGITFADVAGSLAQLTQHGTSADQATQELSNTIRNLAAPNMVAVKMMGQLGVNSQDVAMKIGDGPGGRGLAGSLKYLSETVLSQMGPAGTVLLDTFKRSASAGDDMRTMLQNMPPKVHDLAKGLADGSVSLGDWRKGIKELPASQAMLAQQFLVLYNRANGFNDAIRSGGPAAQTYSASIKAMTGGATGLNTTLQLTGANMAGTEERIQRVADAGKIAGANVAGWDLTQKNFNTSFGSFVQTVEVGAIKLGTALLPALTTFFGIMASQKGLLETIVGLTGALIVAVAAYRIKVILTDAAQRLWNSALLTSIRFQGLLAVEYIKSTALGQGLTAVLGAQTVAGRAAALAFSGLKLVLGGGLLFGAALLGARALTAAMEKGAPSVEKFTADLLAAGKTKGIGDLGVDINNVGKAIKFLNNSSSEEKTLRWLNGVTHIGPAYNDAKQNIENADKALAGLVSNGHADDAAKAFDAVAKSAGGQGISVETLKRSLPGYADALLHAKNEADLTTTSEDDLKKAHDDLAAATDDLNTQLQTSIDKFTILNQGALSQEQADEALTAKNIALTKSIEANGTSLDVHTEKGAANRAAVVALVTSTNDKITADFKSNESSLGAAKALEIATGQVGANRDALFKQMTQAGFTRDESQRLIDTILLTPQQVATAFNTPGLDAANAKVNDLHDKIQNLPSIKDIKISATLAQDFQNAAGQSSPRPAARCGTPTADWWTTTPMAGCVSTTSRRSPRPAPCGSGPNPRPAGSLHSARAEQAGALPRHCCRDGVAARGHRQVRRRRNRQHRRQRLRHRCTLRQRRRQPQPADPRLRRQDEPSSPRSRSCRGRSPARPARTPAAAAPVSGRAWSTRCSPCWGAG